MHAADYSVLMQHALQEIAGRGGFVFIHLPVPHPGGFYNRRTHQVGVDGSYLDNLVLADQTLGALLQAIDATPLSDRTTVLVSSDHSWRVDLWRPTSDWRPEDTRVSGGRFDPRPLLIVRFPGESGGMKIARAFSLIDMHGMIEAMLVGRMSSAADLQTWATQH
jgi:membrane-anchored protein YejM (alkaline phosphatase superfamily)